MPGNDKAKARFDPLVILRYGDITPTTLVFSFGFDGRAEPRLS
jgi:hypothetical protein